MAPHAARSFVKCHIASSATKFQGLACNQCCMICYAGKCAGVPRFSEKFGKAQGARGLSKGGECSGLHACQEARLARAFFHDPARILAKGRPILQARLQREEENGTARVQSCQALITHADTQASRYSVKAYHTRRAFVSMEGSYSLCNCGATALQRSLCQPTAVKASALTTMARASLQSRTCAHAARNRCSTLLEIASGVLPDCVARMQADEG